MPFFPFLAGVGFAISFLFLPARFFLFLVGVVLFLLVIPSFFFGRDAGGAKFVELFMRLVQRGAEFYPQDRGHHLD